MRKLVALLFVMGLFMSAGAWAQDIRKAQEAFVNHDFSTAFVEFLPLAEQGDATAQAAVGWMYKKGKGISQNYREAAKWLTLSAEQGLSAAQAELGVLYRGGKGVAQNYKEAAKWFALSAEQGYQIGQDGLGDLYSAGQGVPQNDKEAVKWYKLSAEQGGSWGQFKLGVFYIAGRGVPQNDIRGHMWLNLAASNGEENSIELRDLITEQMTPSQLEKAQELAIECVEKNYKGC